MLFTQQQLEEAYEQMKAAREQDLEFAKKAGDKLKQKIQSRAPFTPKVLYQHGVEPGISPRTTNHELVVDLTDYDDWGRFIEKLEAAGVKMQPWNGEFYPAPQGEYNITNDPDFKDRPKLTYTVRINLYKTND
jgi:hypothetical protein